MSDTISMDVPFPDAEGFRKFIENQYTDDRWSNIEITESDLTGGSIKVFSGKHPARSRFVKDLRPKLHEHGFVITDVQEKAYGIPDNLEKATVINAVPIMWVVMYVNGNVCSRRACRHITAETYCESCEIHNPVEVNHGP